MNAEEVIKTINDWHLGDENRAVVVILIDEAEEDGYLKSDCAILGKRGRIISGLKSLMNESEPFRNMAKMALTGSLIEKIIEK